MTRRLAHRRPHERGSTLLEVMIAGVILLVAMVGLLAASANAARATAIGNRRTAATLLRQSLMDRLTLLRRDQLAALPASAWILDTCYDVNVQTLATNSARSSGYTCPAGSYYQSWFQIVPGANRTWAVQGYAERIDMGCAPSTRGSSLGCVSGDLLLTD